MVDPINLKPLKIGSLEFPVPIVQGGMGVAISTAPLVSAVSNEGGLGVIASVGLGEFEPDIYENYGVANARALRKEIQRTRTMTSRPIGVNIMSVLSDYDTLAGVCNDERVEAIISGAGLPLKLPQYVDNGYTKLIPLISNGRVARILLKRWDHEYKRTADAVVVEGPDSGGHQGFSLEEIHQSDNKTLERLFIDTKENLISFEQKYGKKIPVIVAGGIYSGEDIARYLNLGADGVQIGSRFILTEECEADPRLKQAHLDAQVDDITLTLSPIGLQARVIKNEFYERIKGGEKFDFRCPYKCLSVCKAGDANFCIAQALLAAKRGDMKNGLVLCSTTTSKNDKIYSVKGLMSELVNDASQHYGGK